MTLSTWWQLLDLYEIVLVWPLALVTLYLAVTARTRRGRIIGFVWLAVWLVPFAHRGLGTFYFDHLCKHEAGEFIYRAVDDVEGILQMRPRDGSKDYFDRMAMGDIPEDPWGHTNSDAQTPWNMLESFSVVETLSEVMPSPYRRGLYSDSLFSIPRPGEKYARFHGYDGKSLKSIKKTMTSAAISKHGYTWRETSTPWELFFNIHGGEIIVIELRSSFVLGRSTGYFRSRPQALCPNTKSEEHIERFLTKVLRPIRVRS